MKKEMINNVLSKINFLIKDIYTVKQKIDEINSINLEKRTRNEKKFKEIVADLENKENEIKSLMENKHFSYIQHVDFINKNNIDELNGFNIENKIGCLVKNVDNRILNSYLNKIVNSNKTEIVYEFKDTISNELEYSFYNNDGLPVIPEEIKVTYEDNEDSFYEPNFRYYNRYTTNTFVNNFLFTPKKIKKIRFIFLDSVNTSNDLCNLYSNEYNIDDEGYATLYFLNPNKIKMFNFYKRTDETAIPLLFEYSEDNINFTQMEFNQYQESLIKLTSGSSFVVRIKSEYENFITKEEKNIKEITLRKSEMIKKSGIYEVTLTGEISSVEIIMPFSSYNKFKSEIDSLKLNISDFVTQVDDLYYVNNSFVNYIKENIEEIQKLQFFDDISLLQTGNKFFNFYFNILKGTVNFAPFLDEYELFFKIKYETIKETIDKNYYTPMVFEVSLKG